MLFNNATWYLEVCYSAGSRPRDKGGRGGVSKKVFGWSKNKVVAGGGDLGPLGPSPWICHCPMETFSVNPDLTELLGLTIHL